MMHRPLVISSFALLLPALLVGHAGCSSSEDTSAQPPEAQAEVTEALSPTALPTVTGVPTAISNMVTLTPATAICTNSTDPACCASCTTGATSSQPGVATSGTDLNTWAQNLLSLGTPDLQNILMGATGIIAKANNRLNDTKADNTTTFMNTLTNLLNAGTQFVGGQIVPHINPPTPWVRALPTEYGRFLKQQRRTTPCSLGQPCSTSTWAEPTQMEDLQFRGARSYCAMGKAASALASNSNYTLADTTLTSWWGFGLGQVKPRVKLMTPEAITSPSGAEAFVIPIVLGGELNPVFGPIFPRMPELVHPLVWVTGDAEVESQEDYGTVYGPYGCNLVTMQCGSPASQAYRKKFRNIQHVEALAGRSQTASLELQNVRMATIAGIIDIVGGAGIGIEQGVLDTNHPLARGQVMSAGMPAGSPISNPVRSNGLDLGGLPVVASDAPITRVTDPIAFAPLEGSTAHSAWGTISIAGPRLTWNDDRAIVVRDSVTASLLIGAKADFSIGNIWAEFRADASINAMSKQNLIFREQASFARTDLVLPGQAPIQQLKSVVQSNVVIAPEIERTLSVNPLTVKAKFTVDLFFGSFSFDRTVFKLPSVNLLNISPTIGSEAHRLRVGEYTQHVTQHDGLNDSPPSYSHVPNTNLSIGLTDTNASPGASFSSFPNNGTVASCLATPPATVNIPAPDGGSPATQPPLMKACYSGFRPQTIVYAVIGNGTLSTTLPALPSNVCDTIQTREDYVDDMSSTCSGCNFSAQQQCIRDTLAFLCQGTHQTQLWGDGVTSFNVVSRVRDEANPLATDATFSSLMTTCGNAFGAGNPTAAKNFVDDFLTVHACDSSGTLLGEKAD